MENSTVKMKGLVRLDQGQKSDYVFKECDRKTQKARDSKQIERTMVIYGQESSSGKAGDSKD